MFQIADLKKIPDIGKLEKNQNNMQFSGEVDNV